MEQFEIICTLTPKPFILGGEKYQGHYIWNLSSFNSSSQPMKNIVRCILNVPEMMQHQLWHK